MSMGRPRILYLPNETGSSVQRGFRDAFAKLRDLAMVDVAIFSLSREAQATDSDSARQRIVQLIHDFQPTHILLQHPAGTGLTDADFGAWRRAGSFTLIYHEADPFGIVRNRAAHEARLSAKHSDIAMVVGSGSFQRMFRLFGAKTVSWVPQTFDPASFGLVDVDASRKSIDVTMIGNRGTSRVGFMGHPGMHQRSRFVKRAQEVFGERLALYGTGWSGVSAKGKIAFWEQELALSRSWLSLNWDHYPKEPKYFSNRLPISLASGTVHFTTWHDGYQDIFPSDARFVRFAKSPEHLLRLASQYLSDTPLEQRLVDISSGREWALGHLRQDDLLITLLTRGGVSLPDTDWSRVWSIQATAVADS